MSEPELRPVKRLVVKIGSALITAGGQGLDHASLNRWADQIAALRLQGIDVVLVSSGAVAEGITRLGLKARPTSIHELQATAAVGQMGLVQVYETRFNSHGICTAQILLTHAELAHRERYLNARTTLRTLLGFGVVPVVNENDTVATDEIRFGDNDTLAALVANLIEADLLLILTDQQGLFDANPQIKPDAELVQRADALDDKLLEYAGPSGGTLGRGGMTTKITAARRAAKSGTDTVIASGHVENVIKRVSQRELIGTLLCARHGHQTARKQWLSGHLHVAGQLQLDAGAAKVLRESGASLLAIGVKQVQGSFERGAIVACVDPEGIEVARGLVNYNSEEISRIAGYKSTQIESILGYVDEPELIHRDNLALMNLT